MPVLIAIHDTEIQELGERGCFVRDGFLGHPAAAAAAAEILRLAGAGAFAPARVGRDERRLEPSIRGDEIAWLAADGQVESSAGTRGPSTLAPLWAAFDALRRPLLETAYLRLDRFDVQLAHYAGAGAGYQRHRDAFARGPGQ